MSGYFKKYRSSFDHPFFDGEPYCRRAAWDWMIGRAMYKDGSKRVSGAMVALARGQLCDSTEHMATTWGWTRKKVRTFLIQLADQGMVEIGPSQGRLPSIITISNYDKFQSDGPDEGQLKAGYGTVEGQLRATIE